MIPKVFVYMVLIFLVTCKIRDVRQLQGDIKFFFINLYTK